MSNRIMLWIAICLFAGVAGGLAEGLHRDKHSTSEKVLTKQCYALIETYYPTWKDRGYIYVGNIQRGNNFTERLNKIHNDWLNRTIWQDGSNRRVRYCLIDVSLNGVWGNGIVDKDLVPIFITTYDKPPSWTISRR